MKKIAKIIAFIFALVMLLTPAAMAETPYETYTYSIDGNVLESPDAYVPDGISAINSTKIGLEIPLGTTTDVESDNEGRIYITDQTNNRIVILDKHYKLFDIVDNFVNGDGVEDSFSTPASTFVVSKDKNSVDNKKNNLNTLIKNLMRVEKFELLDCFDDCFCINATTTECWDCCRRLDDCCCWII